MKRFGPLLVIAFLALFPVFAYAQESARDILKAQVLEILSTSTQAVAGSQATDAVQMLRAEILSGVQKGKIFTLENDWPTQLAVGDRFYVAHTIDPSGSDEYSFLDPDRLPAMAWLVGALVLLVLLIGGKQGVRGVLSLAGSFLFIIYVLLPGIIHGYSPVLVSMAAASLIVVIGSYITHGFNKATTSAVFGMIATIVFTGLIALASIHYVHLSGFESDESVFLNASVGIHLDYAGLLLGGILIGLLGVLYDAAIGQAVSVDELRHVGPHLPRTTIFKRAMRIGREHIGALMNTLAIAYVGASLPLLLLFYTTSDLSFLLTINRELFATEITRIVIGSMGLVLTVPITTLIATLMLVHRKQGAAEVIKEEEKKLDHYEHKH